MPNPVVRTYDPGQWQPAAVGLTGRGVLVNHSPGVPVQYTYRLAGSNPPSDFSDGLILDYTAVIAGTAARPIDVYLRPVNGNADVEFGTLSGDAVTSFNNLFRGGVFESGGFVRAGNSYIQDDLVFPANTPPIYNGEYIHHGDYTDELLYSNDLTNAAWSKLSGVTASSEPNGGPFNGSFSRVSGFDLNTGFPGPVSQMARTGININGVHFSASAWLKGEGANVGKNLFLRIVRGMGAFVGVDTPITLTDRWVFYTVSGFTGASDTEGVQFVLRHGDDPPSEVLIANTQLTESEYDISPVRIPTSDVTVSVNTAASAAGTLNGLTASWENEDDEWLWNVLDGEAVGPDLNIPLESMGTLGSGVTASGNVMTATVSFSGLVFSPLTASNRYEHIAEGFTTSSGVQLWNNTTTAGNIGNLGMVFRRIRFTAERAAMYYRATSPGDTTFTSRSLRQIAPARGVLRIINHRIRPQTSEWTTTGGSLDIISRQVTETTTARVLYVDEADGKYKVTDGTNTAESLTAYTADARETVDIVLKGTTMRIDKDGEIGVEVPFTGTLLDNAEFVKFNMHEDITGFDAVHGFTTVE